MPHKFKYELLNISNTHEAIADWLIANPGKGQMGRCAAVFDISRSWLSTLIHQDAFEAMLKAKQGVVFQSVVIPLREKLVGVAHAGIEKIGEIVDTSDDERLIHDITKTSLAALGYGPSKTGQSVTIDNSTHNTLNVDSAALAEARARRSQHYRSPALESQPQSQEPEVKAQAAQLPHSQELSVGEGSDLRSEHVNSPPPVYGDEEAGGEI